MNKHDACHVVDDECCNMMRHLQRLIEAAHAIDAGDELWVLMDAMNGLHAKAMGAHKPYECAAAMEQEKKG